VEAYGSPRPKKFRTAPSAGKRMATVFWETVGLRDSVICKSDCLLLLYIIAFDNHLNLKYRHYFLYFHFIISETIRITRHVNSDRLVDGCSFQRSSQRTFTARTAIAISWLVL
jgi:hypothetical protein